MKGKSEKLKLALQGLGPPLPWSYVWRKIENHLLNRATRPRVIKINVLGAQRGVWRSWLVCPSPSEDAQPCSV